MSNWWHSLSWSNATLVLSLALFLFFVLLGGLIEFLKETQKRYRRQRLWNDMRRHRRG
jgi:hypothetical protein